MMRRRHQLRGLLHRHELKPVSDRTARIDPSDILVFTTLRNERIRLPWFLKYYRDMGVGHFLMIDNGSDDGSADYLRDQPDVSLWSTRASYRAANFGVSWINHLLRRHGTGHWVLVVDPDELFVYPYCDVRPLRALTDWLDGQGLPSFSAMLLDLYPKGPIGAVPYQEGQDPLEIACWFDSGNYMMRRNAKWHDLWIQGGPRARAFFADDPASAPALNKIPLVRWQRGYVYVSSTHALLPRRLNHVYEERGGEMASGCLLHTKFLPVLTQKVAEEMRRREHYAGSAEYAAYQQGLAGGLDLWTEQSERYLNWRQLDTLGLISRGNWL
ncbi:glycosyltransferase family 2 protein [Sinirhodobacter populi]|uniref:Glycosyltransferase family 2 protein n=1 Tax=Paenirhodobacter populi TaxID=2306993 RepID=A0A443KFX0_9RHOB|nr:glycosyltransferase family 2 protein [Sinirhodobacter populi]RWR31671.1 glycosyltransferase family 2 protein [Sinirhodobacter populi]